MPLSQQEARCIELACTYLGSQLGGRWSISEMLDEKHPEEASPEVMVSNGNETAAIEVKRLTGDSVQQAYLESILSLERSLVPTCGGFYFLYPPIGIQLPLSTSLKREVKRQIEKIASTLSPGGSAALKFPRRGHVARMCPFRYGAATADLSATFGKGRYRQRKIRQKKRLRRKVSLTAWAYQTYELLNMSCVFLNGDFDEPESRLKTAQPPARQANA